MIVALTAVALAAAAQSSAAEPVEVIQTEDGRLIYKYTDEAGNITFQDRPPPEYFDALPQEVEESPPEDVTPPQPAAPPAPFKSAYLPYVLFVLSGLSLLASLYVLLAPILQRLRRESTLDRMLRKAGMTSFTDVKLKSGARAPIEVDRIVRTPAGILILGEERLAGAITGTADSGTWQRAGDDDHIQMANPLVRVRQASKIIQKLVGEVPIFNRVIYEGQARFVNGTPATVRSLSAFRQGLSYFTQDQVEARTMDAAWRRLMRLPRSNVEPLRVVGAGWQGWIRRYWREILAGASTTLAVVCSLVAIFLLWDAN